MLHFQIIFVSDLIRNNSKEKLYLARQPAEYSRIFPVHFQELQLFFNNNSTPRFVLKKSPHKIDMKLSKKCTIKYQINHHDWGKLNSNIHEKKPNLTK